MSFEGAYRAQRTEFIPETTVGQPPDNPDWVLYSDAVLAYAASPGHQIGIVRGVGNVDPLDYQPGREEPSTLARYYLQRDDLTADPVADGILRGADGGLPNTHHILQRSITDVIGGEHAGGAVRIYTVSEGCKIGRVSMKGAATENPPKIVIELQYAAEKVRTYRVDQPASAITLSVESTSALDTTQTVTIEDDAGVSEAVGTLTGTTPIITTKTDWASIDAIRLDLETKGDILIKVDTTLELLATLKGSLSYDGAEGDFGIPLMGTGSHATALGDDFQSFLGDVIQLGAADVAEKLSMGELVVDNSIEVIPTNTRRAALEVGERDIAMSVDVFGKAESYVAMVRNLTAAQALLDWVVTNGAADNTIDLAGAALLTSPERRVELGQTVAILNQTFGATGLTITTT